MKKTYFLYIFFFVVIASCNDNRSIYLVVPNSYQIKENTQVVRNDTTIGNVESIKINKDTRVLIEIKLQKSVNIDKTSTFSLIDTDVLGNKQIQVYDTKSDTYFNFGDTIFTSLNNPINKELQIRTLMRIMDSLDSLLSSANSDSMKEIPMLNKDTISRE